MGMAPGHLHLGGRISAGCWSFPQDSSPPTHLPPTILLLPCPFTSSAQTFRRTEDKDTFRKVNSKSLKKALVGPRLECLVLGYLVQERHCGTAVNQRDGHQDGQMVGE